MAGSSCTCPTCMPDTCVVLDNRTFVCNIRKVFLAMVPRVGRQIVLRIGQIVLPVGGQGQ